MAPINGCYSTETITLQLGIACDSLWCSTLLKLQKLHYIISTTPFSLTDVYQNSERFVDVNSCNSGVNI